LAVSLGQHSTVVEHGQAHHLNPWSLSEQKNEKKKLAQNTYVDENGFHVDIAIEQSIHF